METINSIKEKIEEIRNTEFKVGTIECYGQKFKAVNLLRTILIYENEIDLIENISLEEKKELFKELEEALKNKLKMIHSNFSEEILSQMIYGCRRGYIMYPMDIFVIDDAVFYKQGEYNDFGSIYKIKTFMFKNMKTYYEVSDMYFTLEDFEIPLSNEVKGLSREEAMYSSKIISDNINLIYGENITKPIYEFNTDKVFYGYRGLVSNQLSGINVYINMKFDDIGKSLISESEMDIKLCIQNGDEIVLYYVHQYFKDKKPIWDVVKTQNEVWRLTEEVLKLENAKIENSFKLKKILG